MSGAPAQPSLTREMIAARFRDSVPDDPLAMPQRTHAELDQWLGVFMAQRPRRRELWLFGYGSLMWNPALEHAGYAVARVTGYHRRFCLWQWRHRGTRGKPNLMLALDGGGACRALVYRVRAPRIEHKVREVWRRELGGYGYVPRWVIAHTATGAVPALAFVVNRGNTQRYAGRLPEAVVAEHIAGACGSSGPGAEYLLETVLALERHGIRDRHLWRLQRLVAGHIARELGAR